MILLLRLDIQGKRRQSLVTLFSRHFKEIGTVRNCSASFKNSLLFMLFSREWRRRKVLFSLKLQYIFYQSICTLSETCSTDFSFSCNL